MRRVVVTGSCNAVGFTRGEPLDETSFRESAGSPYVRAKHEQEQLARKLADELGIDVVTVLPTAVLGPHDYRKTPTTAPFGREAMVLSSRAVAGTVPVDPAAITGEGEPLTRRSASSAISLLRRATGETSPFSAR